MYSFPQDTRAGLASIVTAQMIALLAILLALFDTCIQTSRAEERSVTPVVSKEEVEAVRMYLTAPGYVTAYKARANAKIGFEESLDAESWTDKISRAISLGVAGAKACGTSLALPSEAPDVIFRVVGRSTWDREGVEALLDMPKSADLFKLSDELVSRIAQNGLVSLSDDSAEGPLVNYFFYTIDHEREDSRRLFSLFRAAFGLAVGPEPLGSGLFSYFVGGGSLADLVGPPDQVDERICRAINMQNIFCGPINEGITSDEIRETLQEILKHCHSIYS